MFINATTFANLVLKSQYSLTIVWTDNIGLLLSSYPLFCALSCWSHYTKQEQSKMRSYSITRMEVWLANTITNKICLHISGWYPPWRRLNNLPKLGSYRPYSSPRVNKSATPLTKKLPWARINLATFRPRGKHCTTEPPSPHEGVVDTKHQNILHTLSCIFASNGKGTNPYSTTLWES